MSYMSRDNDHEPQRPSTKEWITALVIGAVVGVVLNLGVDAYFSAAVGIVFAIAYMVYRYHRARSDTDGA